MLERTALRMATVMLLSNGFNHPAPTMALARVFDSRIDALQVATGEELYPTIKVCTDDDNGESLSTNNGGFPFERSVTLSIDLAIMVPSEEGTMFGYPASEAELEMALDLFEAQVERLLTERPGIWGREFDRIARRITSFSSIRYVEPDGNTRLAARQMQMTVMLPLDNALEVLTRTTVPDAPSVPAPLGPLLDVIIANAPNAAPDAERVRDTVLGGLVADPRVLPPLERVRFFEKAQMETNEDDVARGPRHDGVAEATLPIE